MLEDYVERDNIEVAPLGIPWLTQLIVVARCISSFPSLPLKRRAALRVLSLAFIGYSLRRSRL